MNTESNSREEATDLMIVVFDNMYNVYIIISREEADQYRSRKSHKCHNRLIIYDFVGYDIDLLPPD